MKKKKHEFYWKLMVVVLSKWTQIEISLLWSVRLAREQHIPQISHQASLGFVPKKRRSCCRTAKSIIFQCFICFPTTLSEWRRMEERRVGGGGGGRRGVFFSLVDARVSLFKRRKRRSPSAIISSVCVCVCVLILQRNRVCIEINKIPRVAV